tara:strand:+ start:1213 stop:1980 length:768 start_codon:yes stop_codon:yes gene_type:complete
MFKNYLNLKKKFSIRNSRVYKFKNEPLLCYIMAITSYWVSPIFFILKIKPNSITALNFFIALTSIILILIGDVIYFYFGIVLYFVFRVLDFCDGNIARVTNNTSFYGRFIDASLDIFYESILVLSIGYFSYKIFANEYFFFMGIVASIFAIYGSCIMDKYSSLVRWSNSENKTNIKPYIKHHVMSSFGNAINDIINFSILLLPFLIHKEFFFKTFILILFFTYIIFGLFNLVRHFNYARINLNKKAKDKKIYSKK